MEKDKLIERLNFTLVKKDVLALAELFSQMEDGIEILFKLCHSDNETLAFHSAWVFENVLTTNPDLFAICLSRIIEDIPNIKNPRLQRHFSKLLKLAMETCSNNRLPKDACQLLKKIDMEPVVESCFEWLMNPDVKPAVKAHCMDILLFLSKRYDWIAEELPHVIELQMIDATPGIINKGAKTIESLRKNKYNSPHLAQ